MRRFMRRETLFFSGLFICSLALAWWASLPVSNKDAAQKSIVSLAPAQIASMELSATDNKVVLTSQGEDRWWIESEKPSGKERFLASAKMKDVLSQFNPLEAIRVIGPVKDESLAEYGLAGTQKTIRVLDRSGTVLLTLAIGKQAYGTRNFFAQDLKDKSVMLITGEFVSDLEKAELRLYERTFTNLQLDELQGATVSYNDKTKKLSHTRRDDKGALLWTNDSPEGTVNAPAKSWFERIDRTRIVSFATEQELEALKTAKPLFSVEWTGSGSASDVLVFVKIPANVAQKDAGPEYYVQSKFIGTWAKVASARLEPIEKDLPTIVSQ